MTQVPMLVPPPDNWQDFERLMFSVCEAIWPYDSPAMHGRSGQEQHGVDIYSQRHQNREWVGVQCKRRNSTDATGDQKVGGQLTVKEIEAEIKKAESFEPILQEFIIATTASTDAHVQSELRAINSTRGTTGQFNVKVWFWEDIQSYLNQHPHVMYRYYAEFLRSTQAYDADKHILSMLHLAFSRPAFNTYLHSENSCDDLLQAIKDTQSAIQTGVLRDRESGDVLRTAPSGARGLTKPEWRASLDSAGRRLAEVRDDYTQAIQSGIIVQHKNCTEVRDHETSHRLNRMRGEAIAELNTVLSEAGLDSVESRLLAP